MRAPDLMDRLESCPIIAAVRKSQWQQALYIPLEMKRSGKEGH